MGSRKGGVAMKPSQLLKFAQLARPGRPSALAPLWVQVLSQEVHPTVVVGVSVGEGVFANGLSGAGGPVGQLRRAEGRFGPGVGAGPFDVPLVHAASGNPHVAEGSPGDDPATVPEAFPTGGDGSRGCHGLFPASGQPLLREAHGASSAGEAVPDVVDGRGGPAPGHLCPGGSSRPREPVSVASAVGPGDGASCSRPASVGRCRLIDGSGRSRVSRASSRPRGAVPDGPGPPTGVVGPAISPAGNTVDGGSPRRSLRSSSGNSEKPGRPAAGGNRSSRLSCGVWSTTFGGPLR
jgi:hypothetical protein